MRVRAAAAFLAIACAAVPPVASAQQSAGADPPDLSGTWRLDPQASTGDPAVAYAGLGGNAGTPTMLYVTQARNGTIIVGSNMNTSHARTYLPGGESRAPFGESQVAMRTRWVGGSLVSEGRDPETGRALGERLTKREDGASLLVEIRTTGEAPGTELERRLAYRRVTTELPCDQWSTPCRDWSREPAAGDTGRSPP